MGVQPAAIQATKLIVTAYTIQSGPKQAKPSQFLRAVIEKVESFVNTRVFLTRLQMINVNYSYRT